MKRAREIDMATEGRMLLLWKLRCNTQEISERTQLPEWQIDSVLARLRARGHGEKGN